MAVTNKRKAAQRLRGELADHGWRGEQPLRVACGVAGCGFAFDGPATLALERALEHRRREHPDLAGKP